MYSGSEIIDFAENIKKIKEVLDINKIRSRKIIYGNEKSFYPFEMKII